MARIVNVLLVVIGTLLLIRAGQIYSDTWKASESRKALLAHFVDHTTALTDHQVYEKRFWSGMGDHAETTFFYYLFGALVAMAASDCLARWQRKRRTSGGKIC